MNTLKLLTLATFVLLFSQCKTTAPTAPSAGGASVLEVTRTLDTVYGKFYELAQHNLSSSPGQVLQLTADWVTTQPNVKNVFFFDSAYLDIELKSGLRTTFMINRVGSDSLSLSRGGPHGSGGHLVQSGKTNHTITNKNVLIFSPFIDCIDNDLYKKGELDHLVNIFKNSGQDFKVTLLQCTECTISAVESFGNYGLVIIDTHGVPDGFLSGNDFHGLYDIETTEEQVKTSLNSQIPDGYNKIISGNFRFTRLEDLSNIAGWQTLLKRRTYDAVHYLIMVNSKFINSLPPMPNTIIVGNMCYSGWNNVGTIKSPFRGSVNIEEPIGTAFTNKQLISYYSYGYDNGESAPVDNNFSKRMEDSLVRELVVDGDSTGNAYLNPTGQEFTASQLTLPRAPEYPDLPFKHFGADDYSYQKCADTITDERDGQKYATVCIDKQTWMAENLRYDAPGKCYNDDPALCKKYGRLYDWNTAMQGAASTSASPSGVQGICPKGWHLPSRAECFVLFNYYGPSYKNAGAFKDIVLWIGDITGRTNKSGFSILPAGFYNVDPSFNAVGFQRLGYSSRFWTTDLQDIGTDITHYSTDIEFDSQSPAVAYFYAPKTTLQSCRCLKD